MLYKKILKQENARFVSNTIGDLIRNYNIELDEYLMELLHKFPVDDKYDITFDKYYVIELENYTVHVFKGSVLDVSESPDYTIILDLRHFRVYYIGGSIAGNSIHEYDIMGNSLDEKDYGLKGIDIDEFIGSHLVEYNCKTINDLLVNFNLDLRLSDKLRQHKIDYGMDVFFNEYLIQEHDGKKYYVFKGFFDTIVLDLEPPIYYIDMFNQKLFVQNFGLMGLQVTVYDVNDEEVDTIEPVDYHFTEINIGKILES